MGESVKAVNDQYAYAAGLKLDEDVKAAMRRTGSLGGPDITPREADWIDKDAQFAIGYQQLFVDDRRARLELQQTAAVARTLVAQAYARNGVRPAAPAMTRGAARDVNDLVRGAVGCARGVLLRHVPRRRCRMLLARCTAKACRPQATDPLCSLKRTSCSWRFALIAAIRSGIRLEPSGIKT